MPGLAETIFGRITEAAKMRGISIRELERRAGLRPRYVHSSIAAGSLPGADVLAGIADAAQVGVDWLLGRTDNPVPPPATGVIAEAQTDYRLPLRVELDIPPGAKAGDEIPARITKGADDDSGGTKG